MKVTKSGVFHVDLNFDITKDGFWQESVTVQGHGTVRVLIFVSDSKANKHVIESHWPGQQGGLHTGITIDEDQFTPLYKKVGTDLARECISRGGGNVWLELEYDDKELPDQYFSGNVATKNFTYASTIKVGGSVGAHPQMGYFVYINHGPY